MKRYFFNVTDGHNSYSDREGTSCSGHAAAEKYAAKVARELADDGGYEEFHIQVTNAEGTRLMRAYVTERH